MKIEDIKKRLEDSEQFKYWNEEVGISFDDFKVIDTMKNKVLCNGSDKIGSYCIMILEDDKLQVGYDLTVESMREKRLRRVEEQKQ